MGGQVTQERREQIFNSALKLMRSNGFQGTTMRDIAADLGIEAASLYNHISSKEDILRNTCFSIGNRLVQSIHEVNDLYFNAEEKLRWAVKNHVLTLTENLDASYVFIHEWRNLSEPQRTEFISLRDDYEKQFTQILETGETEHLFNATDKKFAVLTILASLNWIVEWYRADGKMKAEDIAVKLGDFILTGLRKDSI